MAFIPAREIKGKKKSDLERALEYSEFGLKPRYSDLPEHYDPIRDDVDMDETTENIEFMLSRGKESKFADYNRRQKSRGLKVMIKPVPPFKYK
jgi:hypothetical protein